MKRKSNLTSALQTALFALAAVVSASAATVTTPYDNDTDGAGADVGFLYSSKIVMTTTDAWNAGTITPGAWSYRDLKPAANPNRGWGHTSEWYLFELGNDTYFNVNMTSADPNAKPGFVIYAGESINDAPADAHTYSNNGNDIVLLNDGWDNNGPAGAPGLVFKAFGYSGATADLSGTFFLPAGLYTVALGNAADSTAAPPAVAYGVNFTTVPEPSSLAVLALGAFSAFGRRRRVN